MNINENELKEIIKIAFEDGENWGVTYSTWFEPTQEQTNNEINKTINNKSALQEKYNNESRCD